MKQAKVTFDHIVRYIHRRNKDLVRLSKSHQAPFYAYDEKALDVSIMAFQSAFKKHLPRFATCYALKLNHHPFIINRVVERGLGLDVASIRELKMALKTKASLIVYYSPGKTEEDLQFIMRHADRVRIHIDSISELHTLGALSNKLKKNINAGVRIHFPTQGAWKKYGIHLNELHEFWKAAQQYPYITLNGIHFHQSRNRTPIFYTDSIEMLGKYLKKSFSADERAQISYIDLGGGYEPFKSEGTIVHSKNKWPTYTALQVPTIETYASMIGKAIYKHLHPLINATYITEPGRYICNNAFHIVLRVVDIKDSDNCILGSGVNMVGWQRFEHEYFPLINITRPSQGERPMNMWGNLCTTWDTWGYYVHGREVQVGDLIVVPYQGALTYSLAQSFINAIPQVYKL